MISNLIANCCLYNDRLLCVLFRFQLWFSASLFEYPSPIFTCIFQKLLIVKYYSKCKSVSSELILGSYYSACNALFDFFWDLYTAKTLNLHFVKGGRSFLKDLKFSNTPYFIQTTRMLYLSKVSSWLRNVSWETMALCYLL